ncbi:MAG: DNA phosphorothioation-associated putative methyltransferase [Cyanobacteria bacterium J06635_1]
MTFTQVAVTQCLSQVPPDLVQQCQQSTLGKCLPGAFYIHVSAIEHLAESLQRYEAIARQHLRADVPFTLIKFHFEQPKISYLYYPNFDQGAHPALQASVQVNLTTGRLDYRDYSQTPNPPILHRKETFLAPTYPRYQVFAALTRQQDAFGLLDQSRTIGTQQGWEARLRQHRLMIHDHALACPLKSVLSASTRIAQPKIERHKAAIVRKALSKPVRLALEAGLFVPEVTFFDYGCGHGGDVSRMGQKGFSSLGWDPFYRPETVCQPADIVNLGYVINVIENQSERRDALLQAWQLAHKVLIVAAQVLVTDSRRGFVAYEDGVLTRRNTFQKYYEQAELKAYIDQVLGVDAVPAALGIYFVFRDEAQAEIFRASRFRSRATTPRIRLRVKRFEDYKELLQPVMDFYTQRGRLPTANELEGQGFGLITSEFGSLRRAFKLILQATHRDEWDAIAEKRRQDLLVYLALSQFGRRPKFRQLSSMVQHDIKSLFGSYQQACTAADLMLMSLGTFAILSERCQQSPIGQQHPNSLWVHVSALDSLDPLLRLYEGCASRTLGRPEDATIVKFHMGKPKITYLFFPTFDTEPHPALQTSMQVDLQALDVRYRDYDPIDNPPLLHQKEQVLTPDYLGYRKFMKLSQQEHSWGLLDDVNAIYDRRGWEKCLMAHCAELKGHRVIWRKDADPYRKKLMQAARRQKVHAIAD